MALDPYSPCPCGSGKKLKFCCSDIAHDIEKIHRMMEGDQPHAALRHVEQSLAKHPQRASLLDLKCILELLLDELAQAQSTIAEFLLAHPQNPTALAVQAVVLARSRQARPAVTSLQRAIALVDKEMPLRVFEALGMLGQLLLASGHIPAAQSHLLFYAALAPKDDRQAMEVLNRLNQEGGLPLLLRERIRLRPAPADVPWRADAQRAEQMAEVGKWEQAVAILDRLGGTHGAQPTLVFNRAVLGGWLADDDAFVAGLHAFATLDIPLDEAVEAEAIAQLLDRHIQEETVDTVRCEYPVQNMDDLEARLQADRRVDAMPPGSAPPPASDGRRPRLTGVLFDRPAPDSGRSLTAGQVPLVVGFLNLYGRQTDRAECLELVTEKSEEFERTTRILEEVGGEALGTCADEEPIGKTSRTELALSWRWSFPADTPTSVRRDFAISERKNAIVSRWPHVPRAALGGKSPHEVASQPEFQIPLLACVLILEQASNNAQQREAIGQLRADLNLPPSEPIAADEGIGRTLPLIRVPRLNLTELTDEDLLVLYRRAKAVSAHGAASPLARERLRRRESETLAEFMPVDEAYQHLIAALDDPFEALELLEEARNLARQEGNSTAVWDVSELSIHLGEGDVDQVERVLKLIDEQHGDNQEVATAVYRLLYEAGLISDDQPGEEAGPERMRPDFGPTAQQDAEQPQIWTPGSETPGPTGKKSAIWTPS